MHKGLSRVFAVIPVASVCCLTTGLLIASCTPSPKFIAMSRNCSYKQGESRETKIVSNRTPTVQKQEKKIAARDTVAQSTNASVDAKPAEDTTVTWLDDSAIAGSSAAVAGEEGTAVFYGSEFNGRKTASGEIFDNGKLTAAHRILPFGTVVRVTGVENGKSVDVVINDRGPFGGNHVIDLSRKAAQELGLTRQMGVMKVRLEVVK